jgi:hypothetical protein
MSISKPPSSRSLTAPRTGEASTEVVCDKPGATHPAAKAIARRESARTVIDVSRVAPYIKTLAELE